MVENRNHLGRTLPERWRVCAYAPFPCAEQISALLWEEEKNIIKIYIIIWKWPFCSVLICWVSSYTTALSLIKRYFLGIQNQKRVINTSNVFISYYYAVLTSTTMFQEMMVVWLTFKYFQQKVTACINRLLEKNESVNMSLNFSILERNWKDFFNYTMDWADGNYFPKPLSAVDFLDVKEYSISFSKGGGKFKFHALVFSLQLDLIWCCILVQKW